MSGDSPLTHSERLRAEAVFCAIRFHEGASRMPLWAKPDDDKPAGPLTLTQLLHDADRIRAYLDGQHSESLDKCGATLERSMTGPTLYCELPAGHPMPHRAVETTWRSA